MNTTSLFIIFRAPGYTKAVCTSPTRKVRIQNGDHIYQYDSLLNDILWLGYYKTVWTSHHCLSYSEHRDTPRLYAQVQLERSGWKWRSYLSIWITSGWYPVIGMLLCYIQSTNYYYLCSKMWVFSSVLSKTSITLTKFSGKYINIYSIR